MIDIDNTFYIQLVNFILILLLLNAVLIGPIRKILKKRAELMAAQLGEIEKFSSSSKEKLANYEASLEMARKEAGALRNQLKDEGSTKEKQILEQAGLEVSTMLASARADISAQSNSALQSLKSGIGALAAMAAGKILGKAA